MTHKLSYLNPEGEVSSFEINLIMANWNLIFKRAWQAQFFHHTLVHKTKNVYFFNMNKWHYYHFYTTSGLRLERNPQECPFQGLLWFMLCMIGFGWYFKTFQTKISKQMISDTPNIGRASLDGRIFGNIPILFNINFYKFLYLIGFFCRYFLEVHFSTNLAEKGHVE